ncbi:MAG: hypothetical protein JWR61_5862 [Ferruginibacter sp.]|nr:hypothetical protein [Ferruginibacter sp.]
MELKVGQVWTFRQDKLWATWELVGYDGQWRGLLRDSSGGWASGPKEIGHIGKLGITHPEEDNWTLDSAPPTEVCANCDLVLHLDGDYLCPACRAKASANLG